MRRQETLTGYQDLDTGLAYDNNGDVIVPEIKVPHGAEIHQTDQIGVYRRTVFTNGQVETVQTKPSEKGNAGRIPDAPVPLPGEQQDFAGTGQDEATKPKVAPSAKAPAASSSTPKTANK